MNIQKMPLHEQLDKKMLFKETQCIVQNNGNAAAATSTSPAN